MQKKQLNIKVEKVENLTANKQLASSSDSATAGGGYHGMVGEDAHRYNAGIAASGPCA